MDSKIKPLPAFYCCYLLRSTVRHASLYIGSSPNPARRLAQHNGQVKGGAVRTSRVSLRPWEMTCIVAGFPSNIAALQFEWAWQNPHLTRHISSEQRISFPVTLTKTNARTGKTRKKPGRPRSSLVDRLSNLHLLLRTDYFSQWPLELRFFSTDVHRAWKSWCERVDKQLGSELNVTLDLVEADVSSDTMEPQATQPSPRKKKADLIGKGGVAGLDPTYARYQGLFEKLQFLLDENDDQKCEICQDSVDVRTDLFSVCLAENCSSMSHITCLSERFLRDRPSLSMVPTKGCCPRCDTILEWSDLMRTVSLRVRGQKEVCKLLKKRSRTTAATAAQILDDDEESEGDDDQVYDTDEDGNQLLGDDDDNMSVTSVGSIGSLTTDVHSPAFRKTKPQSLEIVIEDSEDER